MRIHDADHIRSIITAPGVWPWVSEGASAADYKPQMGAGIYLQAGAGFLLFRPWSVGWWDVHVAMPRKSGPAKDVVLPAFGYMRSNHAAVGFVARMSSRNGAVIRLARSVGFVECGRIHGCLGADMVIMEMK